MKLIRSLAVYLYLALVVVFGVPYFKHLEKKKETLGAVSYTHLDVYKRQLPSISNNLSNQI